MKKRLFSILLAAIMVFSLLPVTAFAAKPTYAITNGTPEGDAEKNHGYIVIDKETAAEGDPVTITVKPNEGYQLKSLTVTPVVTFKAVYNTVGGENTLTFYYDNKDHRGEGITVYEGASLLNTDKINNPNKWGYDGNRSSITSVVIDASVAGYKGLKSTAYMFQGMTAASDISGAEYLDVSNVTDMAAMFWNFGSTSSTLNSVPDVKDWNTVSVKNMQNMFTSYGAGSEGFNAVPDVGKWNTDSVTNMTNMFWNFGSKSSTLNSVPDVKEWNTASVTKMDSMFESYGESSNNLNKVPDVSKWNTVSVTNMGDMFLKYGYTSMALNTVPDVSGWNTSNVTTMANMFQNYGYSSTGLDTVPNVSKWKTGKVTSMTNMFNGYGYTSTNISCVLDLSGWDLSTITSGDDVFNFKPSTFNVTIPAKTGEKSNESGKWYYGNGDNFIAPPEGKSFTPTLSGVFTVSDPDGIPNSGDEKKVRFSQGNLQATYNSSASTYTWGFAANQYDYIGNAAGNTTIDSQTNGAVVDLFGWSTSTNGGSSTTNNYGIMTSETVSDYSGDFYDWGKAVGDGNTWRTLSSDEWNYLLNNHSKKWATVNGLKGYVIAPDGFDGTLSDTYADDAALAANNLVFLPAAGYRYGSDVSDVDDIGSYWSSTAHIEYSVFSVYFDAGYGDFRYGDFRYSGCSVRLVTEVKAGDNSAPANKLLKSPAPKQLKSSAPATITPAKQQDGTYQFTMPAANVTVTATFEAVAPAPDNETAKILAALSGDGEQGSIEGVLEVKDDESTGFRTVKLLKDVDLGAANVTVAEGVFLDLNHFNLTTTGTVTNNGTIILHQENADVIDYLLYNAPGNYGTSEELKLPNDEAPDYVIPASTFMTAKVGTNPAYQELGFASGDNVLVWNKDVPAGMQLKVVYSLTLGGNILSAKTAGIKDTNVTAVNFALNDNISIGSNTETDGAAVLNVTSIYDELFGDTIATFAANGKTITLNKTGKLVISSDATGFDESVLVSGEQGMSIQKKENKAAKTVTYSIAVPSPALNGKTATTITITAVEGLEYSINDGAAWVSDGGQGDGDSTNGTITFAALNANTPYTIIARVQATGKSSTASVITTKSAEQSAAAAEPVDVSGGEIKSGDTVVEITTTTGIELPDTALNEVAAQINNVLNNEKVKDFGKVEENDDTGIIAATDASKSAIAEALKNQTEDTVAKGNVDVNETDISKYLNVTLVSAEVNAGIGVTVTAMTFDVTPMATITVTGSTGSVTLTTEITNNEIGDTVTFLLPVDNANTALTAAVYHEDEFLGNFEVKTDVSGKYIEVSTNSFSEFGYITLDATTAGAQIGDTYYASLSDAVSAVQNNEAITLLKNASGTITVSRAVKFTVDVNGNTNNAAITAGIGYTVSKSGSTYTVSAYSGGGDGGTSSYAVELPANVKNGKVEVSPKNASAGQTVTLTVTPDKGFTLETLTVLDKNGKEVEVKNLGNNKYSFKMPTGKVTISATFMEDNSMLNFFVDVKATDYYYDAVLWAAENGITSGVDAVHFAPLNITTRAQMVTFLWRAAGSPEPTGDASKFVDVKVGSFYEKAVAWAIEQGITVGTSETTFSPDVNVSRAQAVTFLTRMSGVKDDATGYTHKFADVKTADYFNNAVAWAATNKITDGTGATTFSPNDDCLRCQIVTFLYRYFVK